MVWRQLTLLWQFQGSGVILCLCVEKPDLSSPFVDICWRLCFLEILLKCPKVGDIANTIGVDEFLWRWRQWCRKSVCCRNIDDACWTRYHCDLIDLLDLWHSPLQFTTKWEGLPFFSTIVTSTVNVFCISASQESLSSSFTLLFLKNPTILKNYCTFQSRRSTRPWLFGSHRQHRWSTRRKHTVAAQIRNGSRISSTRIYSRRVPWSAQSSTEILPSRLHHLPLLLLLLLRIFFCCSSREDHKGPGCLSSCTVCASVFAFRGHSERRRTLALPHLVDRVPLWLFSSERMGSAERRLGKIFGEGVGIEQWY